MVINSWSLNRRWQRLRRPVAVGLIAIGGLLLWGRENAPRATVPTLVARTDLSAGEVVGPDDVEVAAWPQDSRPPPVAADPGPVVGRRAACAIRAGEPLTAERVVGASLLQATGPDAVAVALPAEPLAQSGLVRPGDRVSVVGGGSGPARILADSAPVLTVDQEVGTVVAVPSSAAPTIVAAAAADAIALVLAQA